MIQAPDFSSHRPFLWSGIPFLPFPESLNICCGYIEAPPRSPLGLEDLFPQVWGMLPADTPGCRPYLELSQLKRHMFKAIPLSGNNLRAQKSTQSPYHNPGQLGRTPQLQSSPRSQLRALLWLHQGPTSPLADSCFSPFPSTGGNPSETC